MKITGAIKQIKETVKGTTQTGSEWEKLEFVISNNEGYEDREQIFCFELFGKEKVDKFTKFNKVGDTVDVSFNIRTNEWKDKHFTSLQAWSIFKSDNVVEPTVIAAESDDLPF